MQKIAFALAVLFLPLFTSCATAPARRIDTPSGVPEIQIRADKKHVIDFIASQLSSGGATIKSVNDYSLVAEIPAKSMGAALLFGSRFNGTPNERATFNFSQTADLTHIRVRYEMVTNPGSGFENATDLSATAVALQDLLTNTKKTIEGGVVGVMNDAKTLAITSVVPGSPAERAGLRVGDKIVQIGDQTITSNEQAGTMLRGEPGTDVTVTVLRGSESIPVTVKRAPWVEVYGKR
jgi:membrane-associated protease RseP (regulator of RpoE activity)